MASLHNDYIFNLDYSIENYDCTHSHYVRDNLNHNFNCYLDNFIYLKVIELI